jgi:hypothetical protein
MRLPLPQFTEDGRHPDHFSEVIETSSSEFLAQCLEPENLSFPIMPPFGSWVKSVDSVSGNKIFAIVTHATTSPIDSVHRATALGLSLEELKEQQPQIFAMLKTEFSAAIVGFETPINSPNGSSNTFGKVYQYLPPRPPQIHESVYYCTPEEISHFTEQVDFLRTLLQVKNSPLESLIAANIRETYRYRNAEREWLIKVGKNLTVLFKDDYDCLKHILNQIHY